MEVWTLTFSEECSDCDGVFSSFTKAVDAFNIHKERCSDVWKNVEKVGQGETWLIYKFFIDNTQYLATIQAHIVDEI